MSDPRPPGDDGPSRRAGWKLMGYTLGIDVGPEVTTAVMRDGHGRLTPLQLGHDRLPTSSAVLRAEDGSTTVGDAAVEAPGHPTLDPMAGFAATDDPVALRAMISHVLGRAAAAYGEPPDLVGITHPEDWDLATRNRLVAVVRTAGAGEVVAVAQRAGRPPFDGDPLVARAAGAAVAAAAGVGPIVTRDELGHHPPTPPPPPPHVPVSVFDETGDETGDESDSGSDSSPPPVAAPTAPAPTPAPSPADAATTAMPVLRPSPRNQRKSPNQRRQVVIVVAVAVVAVALIVVLSLLAGLGSDGGSSEAVTSSTVTTTSAPTTTASTTSSTSTSSTSSSTTTSTTSSSTTSTSTSSTTTIPRPVGTPGPITLVETGLVTDTGSVLRFGDDADRVLEALVGTLGKPDTDTGFSAVEFCFSALSRFVRWGQLEVVVGEDDAGVATFTQWYVEGADDPIGLVTIDGLGVGATVGFLEVNYGSALDLVPVFEGSEAGLFAVTNSGSGASFVGITDSLEPEGRIEQMWSGDECQRVFT